MRRTLSLAAALLAILPAGAAAEAGTGPPVRVTVATNTPLTTTLRAVVTEDTSYSYGYADATAVGILRVGDRETGRLPRIPLPLDGSEPVGVSVPVPRSLVLATRHEATRTNHTRATLTFVVTVTDRGTGQPQSISQDSYVSLHAPRRAHRRVAVRYGSPSGGRTIVTGGGQTITGTVRISAPTAWRQSSATGAPLATFLPRLSGGGCHPTVVVQTLAVAVRSLGSYLRRVGGFGTTVRSGGGAHAAHWRVKLASFPGTPAQPSAVGVVALGDHRYAGVRADVELDPACTAAQTRSPRLLAGLQRLVQHVGVSARLRRFG